MRLGAGTLVEVLPRRLARQHRSGVADHPKSLSLIIRKACRAARDRRRLAAVAPIILEVAALEVPGHGQIAGVGEDAQAQRATVGRVLLEIKAELAAIEAPR